MDGHVGCNPLTLYTVPMQAVLLAAGASSRMWPVADGFHKSLIVLMGKPLIQWTIESLQRIGVTDVIIVQGPDKKVEIALTQAVLSVHIHYVEQSDPKGMGDALLQTESLLEDQFLLLHPYRFDADELITPVLETATSTNATAVLTTQETDQPWNYGILSVDGDRATSLIEKPEQGKEPSNLRVTGIYYLPKTILDDYRSVPEAEYAFEDALDICIKRDDVRVVHYDQPIAPLKHPWDVLNIAEALVKRELKETFIHPTAEIDETAVVKGPVHIGPNVRIFEHAVVKQSFLGEGCIVGTGSLVRESTILEEKVLIGAHCEVARSLFGPGSTTHSGFFGDSIFCEEAKAGAGTITANVRVDRKQIYTKVKDKRTPTGLTSLGAIIGAHTHLGINTMLMPGVLIGSDCLVGPGAIAQGSIPSKARYFERTL